MARILIVDDDPALLRLLSLRLRHEGHEVIEADSGEAALARLDHELPALLITDLRMGGMDGLQLFAAVHRRHPLLPVLMLTAHGTIPDAVKALQRGVFGYITKPFEARDLMAEVERALAASQALGADMPGDEPGEAWREAILTRSPRMEQVLAEARLLAQIDASVLIHGDSGTGKELLARAIHAASPRGREPLVAVNCGAIPENLIESELFGHVKGAFTGAVANQIGKFQAADKGTIFLDEVGELPLQLQVKFLRVLQERQVQRVGETRTFPVDVRVVAATNRDLAKEVAAGRFREDLYHRLNVIDIRLPPLRERGQDVLLIAKYFVSRYAREYAAKIDAGRPFDPSAERALLRFNWPGNIRQLENHIKKALVLADGPSLTARDLDLEIEMPGSAGAPVAIAAPDQILPLQEARELWQRDYINHVLALNNGNRTKTARDLGVDPRTIFRHLEKEEKK